MKIWKLRGVNSLSPEVREARTRNCGAVGALGGRRVSVHRAPHFPLQQSRRMPAPPSCVPREADSTSPHLGCDCVSLPSFLLCDLRGARWSASHTPERPTPHQRPLAWPGKLSFLTHGLGRHLASPPPRVAERGAQTPGVQPLQPLAEVAGPPSGLGSSVLSERPGCEHSLLPRTSER